MNIIALTQFESIMPPIELKQADSLKYMAKIHAAMAPGEDSEKISRTVSHFGIKPSQIWSRWYESTDRASPDADIFPLGMKMTLSPCPIKNRSELQALFV